MLNEDLLSLLIWGSVLLICVILALAAGGLYTHDLLLTRARLELKRKLLFCLPLLLLLFWCARSGIDAALWCLQYRANCMPVACPDISLIQVAEIGLSPVTHPYALQFYALSFALLTLLVLLTLRILRQHLTLDQQHQEIERLRASQVTGDEQTLEQA
jgi:hypothetical protein